MRGWPVLLLGALVVALGGCGGAQDVRDLTALRAPGTIDGLQATPADGRIRLTWAALPDDDLIAYKVFRSLEEDAGYEMVGSVGRAEQPWFEDMGADADSDGIPDGLVNGAEYFYRIVGVDKDGRDGLFTLAPTVRARPAIPAGSIRDLQVQDVRVYAGRDRVILTWDPILGLEVSGYRVYREDLQAPDSPELLGTAPTGRRHFADTAVGLGDQYRYRIVPVNRDLVEGRAQLSRVVEPQVPNPTVPLAPGHSLAAGPFLRQETGPSGVTLSWGRPLQRSDGTFFDTGSEDDEMLGGGYVVYRGVLGRGVFEPVAVLENLGSEVVSTWTDPEGGVDHTYMVRAFDRSGALSFESRRVSGGGVDLPDLVRGVDAFASTEAQQILISWSPDSLATGGYRVFRSRRRDGGYENLGDVSPTLAGYVDGADVAIGESWWYRVAPLTLDADNRLIRGALSSPALATPGPSAHVFYLEAEDASFVVGPASAGDVSALRKSFGRPFSGRGALEVSYAATATPGMTTFTLRWVVDFLTDAQVPLRPEAFDVDLLVRRDDRSPTIDVAFSNPLATNLQAAADARLGLELYAERFGTPPRPTMERVGNVAFEDRGAVVGSPAPETVELTVTLQTSDPRLTGDRRLLIDGVVLVQR